MIYCLHTNALANTHHTCSYASTPLGTFGGLASRGVGVCIAALAIECTHVCYTACTTTSLDESEWNGYIDE